MAKDEGQATNQKKSSEVKVNPNTTVGSTYAQAASVTVTDVDATLEFIYVHQPTASGHISARVTMPRSEAEKFANDILATVKAHNAKKK